MYIPSSFRIEDSETLSAFIKQYSFATLITCDTNGPFASHLPIAQSNDGPACTTLVSHMARANPQWRQFEKDKEVLVVFSGPHAYISPSWYESSPAVPTWNYAAVHVYGYASVLHDRNKIVSVLWDAIRHYEGSRSDPWPGIIPDDFRDSKIDAIVAFEIAVTRIEGKFKLGQNRSSPDSQNVYQHLLHAGDDQSQELAALMQSLRLVD